MKETIRRQSIPRPRAVFAIETGELTARLGDDSVEGGHVVQAEFRLACHIDDTFCHHHVRPEIAEGSGPPHRPHEFTEPVPSSALDPSVQRRIGQERVGKIAHIRDVDRCR